MSDFGAAFKKSLIGDLGPWQMTLDGFGEMLPRHTNYIELDPHLVDAWGIPALRVNCAYSDNEKAMQDDMVVSATYNPGLPKSAGWTDPLPFDKSYLHKRAFDSLLARLAH